MTLDPFAISDDIAVRLGQTFTTTQAAQAGAFCADASAVIRDYLRQDISAVVGDTMDIEAPDGPWLTLPQRPVTNVTSLAINGHVVGDFSQIGDRLYRLFGWRWPSVDTVPPLAIYGLKSTIHAVYDHGYSPVPDVIVAVCRRVVMRAMDNPLGASGGEAIDDYKAPSYSSAGTACWLSDEDKLSLRRFRRGAFSVELGSSW